MKASHAPKAWAAICETSSAWSTEEAWCQGWQHTNCTATQALLYLRELLLVLPRPA